MSTEHVLLEGGKIWKQRKWKQPGRTFIVSLVEDNGFKLDIYQTQPIKTQSLLQRKRQRIAPFQCGISSLPSDLHTRALRSGRA